MAYSVQWSKRARDQQHRTLHFIDKVTAAGRMQYGYKFGSIPEDT